MTYQYVRDRLCEEGNRLLGLWMPDPFSDEWNALPEDYNPFDHPLAHQRSAEYLHHKDNCLVCIQVSLQNARLNGHIYEESQILKHIEELQMQAV
jgi:hypothetical protein